MLFCQENERNLFTDNVALQLLENTRKLFSAILKVRERGRVVFAVNVREKLDLPSIRQYNLNTKLSETKLFDFVLTRVNTGSATSRVIFMILVTFKGFT